MQCNCVNATFVATHCDVTGEKYCCMLMSASGWQFKMW
jgi:hypothetical protein